jgi:hypothetical protein
MIEVFRTTVNSLADAQKILAAIRSVNSQYLPNFDLQDSDRILRVVCPADEIDPDMIIGIVRLHGHRAEVLSDDLVPLSDELSLNLN